MALATISDVADALGRDLAALELARVSSLLDLVSARYCAEAHQSFSSGTATVRLLVQAGRVYLPERTASAVASVLDSEGLPVAYTRAGQWLSVTDTAGCGLPTGDMLTVTYSWTFNIPELDRLTVAQAVKRCLTIAPAASVGATQHTETSGPFTQTDAFAPWVVGGSATLSPDDIKVARRWLPAGRGPIVARP